MQKKKTNNNPIFIFLALSLVIGTFAMMSITNAYAQNQAPESQNSQGQGQGPPVQQGYCITTNNGGHAGGEAEAPSPQFKEICKNQEIFNAGECMKILREAEAAGEPSPFGNAIDTDEECKAAFPYTAPNSQNPND